LKVLRDPAGYVRADAAVLYLPRRQFAMAKPALREIASKIRPHLHEDTPMFTKVLCPGVGLAEDTDTMETFGQHRCRVVATALWRGFHESVDERTMTFLIDQIVATGLNPDRMYMRNASSKDVYWLE
jgi:hypothetical protein